MTQLTTNNNNLNNLNSINLNNNTNSNLNNPTSSPISKSQAIFNSLTNNVLLSNSTTHYQNNNISSSTLNSLQPQTPPHQIQLTNPSIDPTPIRDLFIQLKLKLTQLLSPQPPSNHHQTPIDPDPDPSIISFIPLVLLFFSSQLVLFITSFYAIPFVIKLGLSNTSRFFLSSSFPLASVLLPPFVGTRSDLQFSHPYRRRNFIAISTLLIIFSLISLAFCQPLGSVITYLLRLDQGDWDPNQKLYARSAAISVGILSIYSLAFAISSLDQSSKSLALDHFPSENQLTFTIWLNRLVQLANLLLFTFVYHSPHLANGPDQPDLLRKLVGWVIPTLIICSTIACFFEVERPSFEKDSRSGAGNDRIRLKDQLDLLIQTIKNLPIPIKRVCYVEFLSSACWLTIFYQAKPLVSQFKLIELMTASQSATLSATLVRISEREGTRAMMHMSLVSLLGAWVLPALALMGTTDFIINRRGKRWNSLRKFISLITPRTLWSIGLALYAFIIGSCSFSISSSPGAILFVSSLGIFCAVAQWVPLSLVMEYIRSIEETTMVSLDVHRDQGMVGGTEAVAGTSGQHLGIPKFEPRLSEQTPLIIGSTTTAGLTFVRSRQLATVRGGTFLAVFGMASVLPHLLISLLSARMVDAVEPPDGTLAPLQLALAHSLWLFRLAALLALAALLLSRKLVVPTSELDYWDEIKFQIYQNSADHLLQIPNHHLEDR